MRSLTTAFTDPAPQKCALDICGACARTSVSCALSLSPALPAPELGVYPLAALSVRRVARRRVGEVQSDPENDLRSQAHGENDGQAPCMPAYSHPSTRARPPDSHAAFGQCSQMAGCFWARSRMFYTDTGCPYLSNRSRAHRSGGAGTACGAQTRHGDGICCPQASWTAVCCRYLHTHGHALALALLPRACRPRPRSGACINLAGNALRQLTMHISTNDLHRCKPTRLLQLAPSGGHPRYRPPDTSPPRIAPPHEQQLTTLED